MKEFNNWKKSNPKKDVRISLEGKEYSVNS